ncbi:MAG TPA: cyclic pyranopterin monophosphate synthase MoaC [bacterium]|nr:cyclic pyranopterin monophosphate synthase MoaC [bacterium]
MRGLTHLDTRGRARMVDVGDKPETVREAVARGEVGMTRAALRAVTSRSARKGDALAVAQVAAIAAAKRTWELVPLCHAIPLTGVSVDLTPDIRRSCVQIEARVRTVGRTGAEMEALVAVAVAGLTVYDMLKAIERGMVIRRIRLVRKTGGKSGTYTRAGESLLVAPARAMRMRGGLGRRAAKTSRRPAGAPAREALGRRG